MLYLLFGTVGAVLFIYIVVTNTNANNNRNPKEVDGRSPLCVCVVLYRCEYRKIFVLCRSLSVNNWDVFCVRASAYVYCDYNISICLAASFNLYSDKATVKQISA